MMWRTIIVLLLLFIGFNCSFSQTYWVPRNPFLDSLLKWDITISQIDKTNQLQFLPISHKNQLFKQSIIKYKKDLYILIDGTGQVYKASAQNATKIAFTTKIATRFSGGTKLPRILCKIGIKISSAIVNSMTPTSKIPIL